MIYDIKQVHIEGSGRCNSRCPMCSRHTATGFVQPDLDEFDLENEIFYKLFTEKFCNNLNHVYFSGVYGDPCMNKSLPEYVSWFQKNKVDVAIDTNAGYRNTRWWAKLGEMRTRVHFAIDGLEDTNHLYRRNVLWRKVITNVKAFQEAGGNGAWTFIVFKHNEHQDELVKQRSIDEGFRGVKWRGAKSRDYQYNEIKPASMGKYETPIKKPNLQVVCKACHRPDYHGYDTGLYITNQGWLLPCCWWGTKSTMREIYEKYGHKYDVTSHKLDGNRSVQDALDGEWFSNLHREIMKDNFSQCGLHCKENIISTITTEIVEKMDT